MAALAWAVSFATLPEADFRFNNGDEIKTVDPARVTGAPEGRIINGIFEGLYRNQPTKMEFDEEGNIIKYPKPDENGSVPMSVVPAMAESHKVSEDGKTYSFKIRKNVQWTNGEPVTAHDFKFSWQRMLHPETASQYAYQLTSYVTGTYEYNSSTVKVGDHVEVELADRPDRIHTFPRGTMLRGVLQQIAEPPKPDLSNFDSDEERTRAEAQWKKRRLFVVEVKPERDGQVDWTKNGKMRAFSKEPASDLADYKVIESLSSENASRNVPAIRQFEDSVTECMFVLLDFDSQVGIEAVDDRTLVVELKNRTPFFLDLVAFYPLYPVNRTCVEEHGTPLWTRPENIVTNGPFQLKFRRIRDRIRLAKNPNYWNAKVVRLDTIDAYGVKSETTSLNMFLNGQLDWTISPPQSVIPELLKRDDCIAAPGLATYFYRFNVTSAPLDDIHVRRALNLAVDKQLIVDKVTKAGQRPARHLVPPGLPGYLSPMCGEFDPELAQAELAKSKYVREGKRIPRIDILYNTSEGHQAIAEVIQQQWKNNLGIDVSLTNKEWASYLASTHAMEYSTARAGWIGDYPDPNTFLDMWLTDGANNETGWSNKKYDQLILAAAAENDA